MSLVALQRGILLPDIARGGLYSWNSSGNFAIATNLTSDAVGEKLAFIGTLRIAGAPSSSKTFSSSGAKIHWRTANVTWASAGTTFRVGTQGISTTTGPGLRPDGSWGVYTDLVQGTDSLSATTWTTTTMATGSTSYSHGDRIALVFEMTVRNGSDAVGVSALSNSGTYSNSCSVSRYLTSWIVQGNHPNVVIEFDDGTLAVLDEGGFFSAVGQHAYQDSTNPDEYGLLFQVPFLCKVNALTAVVYSTATVSANMDGTLSLYSDPTGTPTSMASGTILGENLGENSHQNFLMVPITEQTLVPGNTYCVALKATSTANLNLPYIDIGSANYASFFTLNNMRQGTRNGSSGAFSETTTRVVGLGMQVSALASGGVGPQILRPTRSFGNRM